jgi:hypothetical protein
MTDEQRLVSRHFGMTGGQSWFLKNKNDEVLGKLKNTPLA